MHDPLCAGAACCSYLALVAALASEADAVFIPEDPVPNNWADKLCKRLHQVGLIEWHCILITHNRMLTTQCKGYIVDIEEKKSSADTLTQIDDNCNQLLMIRPF